MRREDGSLFVPGLLVWIEGKTPALVLRRGARPGMWWVSARGLRIQLPEALLHPCAAHRRGPDA